MERYRWRKFCANCPTDLWDRGGLADSLEQARSACTTLAGAETLTWRQAGWGWLAWEGKATSVYLIEPIAPLAVSQRKQAQQESLIR